MLDRLFKPKTLTHFESCQELKQLHPLLKRLRDKEGELKRDGDNNGVASADFRKHIIISNLLSDLDEKIVEFNKKPSHQNHDEEVKDIIHLVRELAAIVHDYSESFESTLMFPRNEQHHGVNIVEKLAIGAGAYGTAGYMILNFPIGIIGALVMLFYVAPKANEHALETTGLNNKNFLTASVKLLDEISDVLAKTGENLGLAKNWNKKLKLLNEETIPDEFLCPILGKLMTKPVVCSLDGKSYEEGAIKKWLLEKGSSPFNRERLQLGQRVEDVLTINRNLLDAIERMREEKPRLLDSEYQQGNMRVK